MMTETEIEQAVASALAKARAALDKSLAKGIAEAEAHRTGDDARRDKIVDRWTADLRARHALLLAECAVRLRKVAGLPPRERKQRQ